MKIRKGKWISGFWPMVFMSFSTGMIYCWTLLREDIELWGGYVYQQGVGNVLVFTPEILTWCFSLALFFLGMTAAFGGKIVERSVKRASLYTFIFFTLGWLVSAIAVYMRNPILLLIGFGPVQGIGLGLGYLTPIKTLMMWFDKKKGLAAGIALAAFSLAGFLGNPLIGFLLTIVPHAHHAMFIMTALFGILCFTAYVIIDRPPLKAKDEAAKTYSAREVIFSKKFIFMWFIIFLNIASGLALMSHEQQIYILTGLSLADNRLLIVVLASLTGGVANISGRIVCAASQDKTNKKHMPYYLITFASITACVLAFLVLPLHFAISFVVIFIIQFFFGAGFACLPNVLEQHWGMKQLATIQGYILTAWAMAALVGPRIASAILVLDDFATGIAADVYTLPTLYMVLSGMFVVQLIFLLLFVRTCKKDGTLAVSAADLA